MVCQHMVMPQFSNGVTDMFLPDPVDYDAWAAKCMTDYGKVQQPTWILDYYGGWIPRRDFKDATNIIFSNGSLDPWHIGGVL